VRRNQASATKLRETIAANSDLFGQPDLKSLARLTESSNASEAFERLKLKNTGDGYLILAAFIDAGQLFREFRQRVTEANSTLARMDRLANALVELRRFVDELAERSRLGSISTEHVAVMERGLRLIAKKIEAKQCGVKEVMPLFGVTRKTKGKDAAENAAIWSLAVEVRRITGKWHFSEVADLAEVLLGTEVFPDRVRHVTRYRRQRYAEAIDTQTRRLTTVFNERMAKLQCRRLRERQKAAGSPHKKMSQRAAGTGTGGDSL
jgi:hypothetical protein